MRACTARQMHHIHSTRCKVSSPFWIVVRLKCLGYINYIRGITIARGLFLWMWLLRVVAIQPMYVWFIYCCGEGVSSSSCFNQRIMRRYICGSTMESVCVHVQVLTGMMRIADTKGGKTKSACSNMALDPGFNNRGLELRLRRALL